MPSKVIKYEVTRSNRKALSHGLTDLKQSHFQTTDAPTWPSVSKWDSVLINIQGKSLVINAVVTTMLIFVYRMMLQYGTLFFFFFFFRHKMNIQKYVNK